MYSDTVQDDDTISFSTQGGINNPLQYDGDGQVSLFVLLCVITVRDVRCNLNNSIVYRCNKYHNTIQYHNI